MSVLLSSTVSTGRGGRAQGRRLSNLTFGANHDAMHPSARDGRFHRRPSPRRIGCSQSMLRRRQIMDSAHTKTPLRPRRFLRQKITRRTVEEDLSGSFQLSCSSHPQSLYLRFSSRHCRGYGCGWLDLHLSQCHPLEPHLPGRSSGLPRLIPRIIAHRQIAPPILYHHREFQSRLFISPSRGSVIRFFRLQE